MVQLASLFTQKEQEYGLPSGYLYRTAQIESSLNPRAKNPNSSAGGLFQFINSTAKAYGLQDRYDPLQATDAAARLARDNARALRSVLGRDPTGGELYLAHQQGSGGASALLRNTAAPATSAVGRDAVRLNGGNSGMSAGDFANRWISKFGGDRSTPANASLAIQTAIAPETQGAPMPSQNIGGLGGLGGFKPPSQDVGLDTGAILRALGAGLIAGDASAVPAYLQQAIADQQRNADRDYEREWREYAFRTGLEENALDREQARADRYENRSWALQDLATARQNGIADYRTRAEIDAEFRANDPSRGPRTSLSPIYGTDANGDAVLLQPRDDGTIVQTQLPEGVSLSTGVDRIDAGNQWILVDKRSGATVGTVPKDNYTPAFDSAAGTEAGRTTAERTASLGQAQGTAERALAQLDLLENHPGLSSAVGWQGNIPEWMIPAGTETANFLSVLGQVQGQSFLQAFESLKGGGAITEIEGQKATQAITRLSRKLSEAEFKAAIGELRAVINAGLERARNGTVVNVPSAGAPSGSPAAAPAPAATSGQPRSLDDLLSTYGGS